MKSPTEDSGIPSEVLPGKGEAISGMGRSGDSIVARPVKNVQQVRRISRASTAYGCEKTRERTECFRAIDRRARMESGMGFGEQGREKGSRRR